ncbi:MAG TPA: hypothetical protein PLB11_00120 [Flavobacterium sp.]|nr:hypothetical protein [Flavobacterium sp.]
MPKYNSVNNIPAKIFFDVLHEKDFDLLEPIEGEEGLEEVFSAIYDDYFIKTNNPRSKRFLELQQEIYFMNYKIQSVVQIIDFLMFNTTTLEIRKTLLESLISIGVNISLENEFVEEVQNILNIELGILQNDLSFLQIEMKNMQSENTEGVFDFYESLVGLESIHERSLDDEMVLIKYINYEKLALKKAELQKKQNKKYNT